MSKRIFVAAFLSFVCQALPAQSFDPQATPPQQIQPSTQSTSALQAGSIMARLGQAGHEIPRLSAVTPNILRGGQPTANGLKQLRDAGVKCIVDLRMPGDAVSAEEKLSSDLGLRFISIPLTGLSEPTQIDIHRFLSAVNTAQSQPVYVHCQFGRDRTGTMVAIYRMENEGWDPNQAYAEMLQNGFHPFLSSLSAAVYNYGESKGRPGNKPALVKLRDLLESRARS